MSYGKSRGAAGPAGLCASGSLPLAGRARAGLSQAPGGGVRRRSGSPRAGELRRREAGGPSAWQFGFFCLDERGPDGFILKSQFSPSLCTDSALTCGDLEFDSPSGDDLSVGMFKAGKR